MQANPVSSQDGQRDNPLRRWFGAKRENRAELERIADYEGQVAALNRSLAVIEFALDGTILQANANFLTLMGYTAAELRGQHHRMLVEPAQRDSAEYRALWDKLRRGEYDAGQYRRLGKNGKAVWIEASYNPIFGHDGQLLKVVKYATDVSARTEADALVRGQIDAINRSQAVIQFSLDGTILEANANFLALVGYTLKELQGQHHGVLVEPAYRGSAEYRAFWAKLGRGEYDSGQYQRLGKGGREVWIQATYNPVLDRDGKPVRVVKFATDVTQQVLGAQALALAVQQTREVVAAAGARDLGRRIVLEGKTGAIQELCAGVNGLLAAMSAMLGRIKQAAAVVGSGTDEIAQGVADLSARTEQQAATLQETASSMEQLTGTVKQNAENARSANQLAIDAGATAEKGGAVMAEVTRTMSAIGESSRKIVDIIGLINDIAFQTNILALNAAVEAARAGDQGRGFAVVATEVRNLARRSAEAAREIKALIGDSVDKVQSGTALVGEAGKTMTMIVDSIRRVMTIIGEISDASHEQSAGIEQVNLAITQMDEAVQQNAALVEETSAAARTMHEQAAALSAQVNAYQIDEAAGANGPSTRANVIRPGGKVIGVIGPH